MRIFYVFWFLFCGGWGWLMAMFPVQPGDSIYSSLLAFPLAVVFLGGLVSFELYRRKFRPENACLNINLKPWEQPLGVLQFVLLTFLFSSTWGLGFSVSQSATPFVPLQALGMSVGGLTGAWAACRVYRSHHAV